MNAADRKVLRRVAVILNREADAIRESHTVGPKHDHWPSETPADQIAKEDHDEMIELARLLRAMALRP